MESEGRSWGLCRVGVGRGPRGRCCGCCTQSEAIKARPECTHKDGSHLRACPDVPFLRVLGMCPRVRSVSSENQSSAPTSPDRLELRLSHTPSPSSHPNKLPPADLLVPGAASSTHRLVSRQLGPGQHHRSARPRPAAAHGRTLAPPTCRTMDPAPHTCP